MIRNIFISVFAALALSACGGGEAKGKGEREAPLVATAPATTMRFVETIEAVGTARANEQVVLAAPVTEKITRLNFDDGGFVRRGQVIAVLAQGQESAALASANAQAREAQQQLSRITALKNRGFATKSSYDEQVAAAAAARAQAGEVRAQIGDRTVTAPFSGYVSLRNISTGAIVSAGSEIATVSDISTIKLDFTVPETLLTQIRTGQAILAEAAAYPGQPFRGSIATIDPVIDPETRAVTVRARMPNGDGRLKPGMLLTVGIESRPRMSLSVPELAVVGEGENRYVYVVGADKKAKRVPVRIGAASDGRVEILEGIKPGQPVVTEGVVKLSDGMTVRLASDRRDAPAGTRPKQGQSQAPAAQNKAKAAAAGGS